MNRVRQSPVLLFCLLAFGLTWANWVPRAMVSHGLWDVRVPDGMFLVAGYGPALAALIAAAVCTGLSGLKDLGQRLVRWRVGVRWYFVVLLLPVAQAFLALGLHLLFGGEWARPSIDPALPGADATNPLWLRVLLLGLMFTLGFDGLGEELGWRGFALPKLLERHSALTASLVLGAIWAAWHLPFALTPGSAMADRPFYEHLPRIFAASILFTWVFNHTRGSILLAILFHAAGNLTVNLLPVWLPGIYGVGIWADVVPWLVVFAVVAVEGPAWLARRPSR